MSLEKGTFACVVATVFFLPLSEALKNIFFVASLLFFVSDWIVRRRTLFPLTVPGWAFLSFFAAAVVSALASSHLPVAAGGVWEVFRYTSFFFIVLNTVRSEERARILFWVLVLSTALGILRGMVLGLSQGVTLENLKDIMVIRRFVLPGVGAPAVYLSMMLALMIGALLHEIGGKKGRVFLACVTGLSVIALVLPNTRSMWVALLLTVFLFALLKRTWWVPVTAAVLLIGTIGLTAASHETLKGRALSLATPLQDSSLVSRFTIWKGAMAMFRDHPLLGVGPRVFRSAAARYQEEFKRLAGLYPGQAHNLYIHTLAELGIVGLLALLSWLIATAYFLIKIHKTLNDQWGATFWYGAVGSFMTILVGGMIDPVIGYEVALLFMTMMGVVTATRFRQQVENSLNF